VTVSTITPLRLSLGLILGGAGRLVDSAFDPSPCPLPDAGRGIYF
jgi:hypothetical protein